MESLDLSRFSKRFATCAPSLREGVLQIANGITGLPAVAGTKARAYLVGGVVRDLAMGKEATDADIEVYGVEALSLRRFLEEQFPKRVHDVGRAFSVWKVTLEDGTELDVSLPRRESKTGPGHKGFAVEGDPTMTVEDAARRRDFTVNAMMADPLTGEVLDPFGGKNDLEQGVLRAVDKTTFVEDPLRVYRALQFAARFDLAPDIHTRELLRDMTMRGDLDELPKERITEEIRKLLLKAEKPSIGFELARDIGLIAKDYPELDLLPDTPQEPEWHPEGDVWIHTMMVIDQAARIIRRARTQIMPLAVMLGSLCHDLGKPPTTQTIDGRIRSLDHEAGGVEPAISLLSRWAFGKEAEQAVIAIVKEHLKPGMLLREMEKGNLTEIQYVNAVRRLLKRIAPLDWRSYLAACEADYRGRTLPHVQDGNPYEAGDLFTTVIEREHLAEDVTHTLLQGRDLEPLGVPPGPEMGRIIKAVEEARDKGEIRTKKEGLEMAKKMLH